MKSSKPGTSKRKPLRGRTVSFFTVLFLGSCGGGEPTIPSPPSPQDRPQGTQTLETGTFIGIVKEILRSPDYTFLRVQRGRREVWVAGPGEPPKEGERVAFLQGVLLEDFHSKSLGRNFQKIYFVSRFHRIGEGGGEFDLPGLGKTNPTKEPSRGDSPRIFTVASLRKEKGAWKGRSVLVRGKVVKVNAGIMGKNWVHLVDPGARLGTADLVFTTKDRVMEGSTILVKGIVSLNKDFGYGYKYDLILENGTVKRETR